MNEKFYYLILLSVFAGPLVIFVMAYFFLKKPVKTKILSAFLAAVLTEIVVLFFQGYFKLGELDLMTIISGIFYYGLIWFPIVIFFITMVVTKKWSIIVRCMIAFLLAIASFGLFLFLFQESFVRCSSQI